MNLQQFISKWDGKYLEVAGSADAANQCTDAVNGYLRDVLSLPIVEWTNAVDFPEKITGCEFIENTPDGVPNPGDVVVFKKYGTYYGKKGHIGIITEATTSLMRIFEQIYPTGSACKIGVHNYLGCRGWLRKKSMTDDEITIKKSLFEELVGKATVRDQYVALGYGSPAEVKQLVSDLRSSIDDKQAAIDSEKNRAETARTAFNDLIALCAVTLGTQQELNQIKVRLEAIKEDLDGYDDLQKNYASLQISSGNAENELKTEIAQMNALLQQKEVLANVTVADLLRELVRRLQHVLRRR